MSSSKQPALSSSVSQLFRDRDGNDIPDILEGKLGADEIRNWLQQSGNKITIDGETYTSFDELPAAKQEELMKRFENMAAATRNAGQWLRRTGLIRIFPLIGRLFGRMSQGQNPVMQARARPIQHRAYREEGTSSAAKFLRLLMLIVALGAAGYYLFTKFA